MTHDADDEHDEDLREDDERDQPTTLREARIWLNEAWDEIDVLKERLAVRERQIETLKGLLKTAKEEVSKVRREWFDESMKQLNERMDRLAQHLPEGERE
jgi:bacterioferritin (cytochrome b1)